MHGLPGQTIDEALTDLTTAMAKQPEHLSWYQLTLEPNTLFHRSPPPLPMIDDIWEMQEHGQRLLAEHGYQQYEISAYSQAHKQSQHNLNYWQFGDYLGIGAGAHSKITDLSDHKIVRYSNYRHPKDYLKQDTNFIHEKTIVAPNDLAFEFMLNHLRLRQPIKPALFEQRTSLPLSSIHRFHSYAFCMRLTVPRRRD